MIIQNPILTGSVALNGLNLTATNLATTSSNSFTSDQSITGSLGISANTTIAGTLTVTGSIVGLATSASYVLNAVSSSKALSASYSDTASFANSFNVAGNLTASNAVLSGTLTAQTLVVQTVTSSILYSSGSNNFGNQLSDRQTFTGSVNITGSQYIFGNVGIGTASPQTNLSVKGIAANATASTYNGIFGLESVNQTSFQMGIGSTYNGTWFQSFNQPATGGGTFPLIFNPIGGNVGIGTTSPTAKLEVRGTADGDLFIGRFHAGSAKLIYAYQLGSDGYLELRTGNDAIITKLSGYSGTPSYFLSNVGINTTGSNSRVTIVDNNVPNASGNITSGTQFAASIASGFASLNLGAYDDNGSNRYGYLRTAYSDNAGVPSEMRFYTAATERMRISTGGIVTQPYQPAFSIASGAALTGPGTVPFKNVIFDDGSNFNTSTYRFTAPVAGRYFFSFYDNIYANLSTSPNLEFRVNGGRRGALAYTTTKTIGYWYIMSFQQVIKLSSGDYVEVYLGNGDNPDYGNDYSWGNFSGFLIG